MAVRVDAVEHECHVVELLVLVEALDVGQLTAVETSRTHDEDGQVGYAVGNGRVRYDAHGDIVDDDVVIARAQLGYQGVETAVQQQLCRVRRHGTGGDDVEVLALADDVVDRHRRVGKVVGHTRPVLAQMTAQRPLADVEVDDHHPLAGTSCLLPR